MNKFIIEEEYVNERVDKALSTRLSISRESIQFFLKNGDYLFCLL